jgi:hypothetical protein
MKNLLLLAAILVIGSGTVNGQKVKGNGNVVKQDRNVGSFNQIESHGSFDISVTDGDESKVQVEAEDNLQEYIEVSAENDKLKIKTKKGVNFNATKNMVVHVTAPALKAIRLYGSGNVTGANTLKGSDHFEISSSGSGNVNLDVETSSLSADISGSGNVTLKGKTREFEGNIQGSGNIKARDLQSETTSVKIAGSGNAEVVATQKLNTKIAGSGDVKYWGDASVDSKIAGSGSVHREK